MMLAAISTELGIVEIGFLLAAAAYVIERVVDTTGVSRSSRTLRRENEDLVRRNKELDDEVSRLSDEVARLREEISVLTPQVAELQKRDQAAVLTAISDHERAAGLRHEKTLGVLVEIRDAVKAA